MEHASDLERFEVDNRAFFAAHVGDRGDAYFAQFPARLAALVAQNQAGESLCFVTVADGGAVLARVNIADVAGADGSAAASGDHHDSADWAAWPELGFRVAEQAQGQGVATWSVRAALVVAAGRGVTGVQARAAEHHRASQRVLAGCGFVPTGPAPTPPGASGGFLDFRWVAEEIRMAALRQALIAGEQSGPAQEIDIDAFIDAKKS